MRRDSSFAAVVQSTMNFNAALRNMLGVGFLAAKMVDIVKDMVLSFFITGNGSQTFQRYIQVAKFFIQRPDILNMTEDIDGKMMRSRILGM